MIINRFESLNKAGQLVYLKIKGELIEDVVLEDEIIKLYSLHDFLVAVLINKSNYSVKEIYAIDTTEEKIWESISIDALFV